MEIPHRTFAFLAETQAMVPFPMNQPSQFGRRQALSGQEMIEALLLIPKVSFTVSIKMTIPKKVKWMELLTELDGAMNGQHMVL